MVELSNELSNELCQCKLNGFTFLFVFSLEEISTPLQTFPWIQKRHFSNTWWLLFMKCQRFLWNTLKFFPASLFFKLSIRNIAELSIPSSQIQLSDSVENSSIRNKCFPSSLDIQQIPKIKWAIMCPTFSRYFLIALAIKDWYTWKFLPG